MLEALIAGGAAEPDEITLIAELLSLPNAAAALDMSPQRKREKLLAGLLHLGRFRRMEKLIGLGPAVSRSCDALGEDHPSDRHGIEAARASHQ